MTSKNSVLHTAGKVVLSASLSVAAFTTPVLSDGFDNGSGMSDDQHGFSYGSENSTLPQHNGLSQHDGLPRNGIVSDGLGRSTTASGAVVNTSLTTSRAGAATGETAGVDRRSAALAHYARARTMLLESLAEFERARDIARPDLFIDPQQWRSNVINRAQELDNLLNPRPREVAGGVTLSEQPTLIRGESPEQKGFEVHGVLGNVDTPATSRAPEGRARLSTPKKARVVRLKSETAVVEKAEPEKLLPAKVETEKTTAEQNVSEKLVTESKTVVQPKSADTEAVTPDSEAVLAEKITVEKSVTQTTETAPLAAKAAPAPEVKALDEAELRKRLKKLAEEVQAREQTSGAPDEQPAPLGGMSGQ